MTGFQKPHQNFFHPFAIFSPTKYNLYVVHQQNGSPSLHAHTTTLCTIIVTNASQIRLHPGANYLVPLITRTKYKLHSPKDRYTAHDVQFCLGTRTECDWSGSVCCCSVCSTEINHRLRVPVPTYYSSVETREQYTEKRVVLLSHSSPYNQPVCSRITSYSFILRSEKKLSNPSNLRIREATTQVLASFNLCEKYWNICPWHVHIITCVHQNAVCFSIIIISVDTYME